MSNLLLLLVVWLSWKKAYLIDFCVLTMMFAVLTTYHMYDAGWFCLINLESHHIHNHFMCNVVMSWFVIVVGIPPGMASVGVYIMHCSCTFASVWINTLYFFYTLLTFYIIVHLLGFGRGISKFDMSDMLVALILMIITYIPYAILDTPMYTLKYTLYHSLWHMLSMLAIFFVIKSRDSMPFHRKVLALSAESYFLTKHVIKQCLSFMCTSGPGACACWCCCVCCDNDNNRYINTYIGDSDKERAKMNQISSSSSSTHKCSKCDHSDTPRKSSSKQQQQQHRSSRERTSKTSKSHSQHQHNQIAWESHRVIIMEHM
jgi:hypothetical protein